MNKTLFDFHNARLNGEDVITRITTLSGCSDIYEQKNNELNPNEKIYEVEFHDNGMKEGSRGGLFWGISHVYPGKVGKEYYMTKGHFHEEKNTGEYYWGLKGTGLLLLAYPDKSYDLREVTSGVLLYIPGNTAHRLINIGKEKLSVAACWRTEAGHNYREAFFPIRICETDEGGYQVVKCASEGKY